MASVGVVLLFLFSFISGALADTCGNGFNSIYCMFGCCQDAFYIYCCLSNGAGIGIIIGACVLVLSIILFCLRLRRRRQYMAIASGQRCHQSVTPGVTVVQQTSTTGQTNMGYNQAPPPYPTAPPPSYGVKT